MTVTMTLTTKASYGQQWQSNAANKVRTTIMLNHNNNNNKRKANHNNNKTIKNTPSWTMDNNKKHQHQPQQIHLICQISKTLGENF
jgi:hypothetical protein